MGDRMRHTDRALLFALLALASAAALAAETRAPGAAAPAPPQVWQVTWQGDNVSGRLTINGFTISQLAGGPVSGGTPLNIWLTGHNELKVEARKHDPKQPASLAVGVSALTMGDVVSTGQPGQLFNLQLTDAELAGAQPRAVSRTFDSALDFSGHLLSTRPSRFDQKAVLQYAIALHRLFEKKDAKAILKAMSIKAEDYARAYQQPVARIGDELAAQLRDDILKSKLARIDPAQLTAERINNLWHIRAGQSELIRSQAADGTTSELPIYIGDVDGQLAVVR
jgi:hypothetical protein